MIKVFCAPRSAHPTFSRALGRIVNIYCVSDHTSEMVEHRKVRAPEIVSDIFEIS